MPRIQRSDSPDTLKIIQVWMVIIGLACMFVLSLLNPIVWAWGAGLLFISGGIAAYRRRMGLD